MPINEKALDEAKVAATWFTDSTLPVMAISDDVENDRVLKLHFRRPVTGQDRIDLTEALNMKMLADRHASSPLAALPPCGMREALEVEKLREKLRPFHAAVFNDNGDVTVSTGHIEIGDWLALYRAIRQLDAALSVPCGAGCGWQPIETAPKDGRPIVIWRKQRDGAPWQCRLICRWYAEENAWVHPNAVAQTRWPEDPNDLDWLKDRDFWANRSSFTDWMPLPAAPATGGV